MKTANPELNKRMRKASSMIALGTRRNNKPMLEEGRRLSAMAHIENQLLLGRDLLTKEDVQNLAEILFGVEEFPQRWALGPAHSAPAPVPAPAITPSDDYEEEEPAGL